MTPPAANARSIFGRAVEIEPPAERAAYLDEACAGDPHLRERVEALLRAHDGAGSFMAAPAAGEATAPFEPLTEGPGTRVGPYKLLQEIGEGGMGTVFMAEQEEPVRRKVALKIIKPGMDSKQVVARFEAERQALSMMDHPNIARVLDAGTTASGRPYFVMELVHGVPITEFCDANKLTPKERLGLFVPVCQAIQHAHQKGIIHRDVKPSNVLVTMYDDKPVPKVIDFGVAKAVEQRLTEKTLFTQYGALVGTFEYMSPEQAEMNAFGVDTRSDVYSLGVLLYELLTGSTPLERQRVRIAALGEVVRLIKEEEPPRPSVRLSTSGTLAKVAAARKTEPGKLSAVVRGELDWIAMRCLEKDRARRYESASALAKDVERFLGGDAVEACPPTLAYRLRKSYRRNKAAVLVGSAFAAVLLAAAGVSLGFGIHADRSRRTAEAAERQADADRDAAVAAGKEADDKRRETGVAYENLRRANYAASMNLVQSAWEQNNLGRVYNLLDRQRPGPGEPDVRGFEWHYWDREAHAEIGKYRMPIPTSCTVAAIGPDGRLVATLQGGYAADRPTRVQVWETATGKEIHAWALPRTGATGGSFVAFSGDGTRLAFSEAPPPPPVRRKLPQTQGASLRVWDVGSGKDVLAQTSPTAYWRTLTLTHDGKRLAVQTEWSAGLHALWDVDAGKPLALPDAIKGTTPGIRALSPDGTRLVTHVRTPAEPGAEEQTPRTSLAVWDTSNGERVSTFDPSGMTITGGGFSPDGKVLAVGGWTNTVAGRTPGACVVRTWDVASGEPRVTITTPWSRSEGSPPPHVEVVVSPDGNRLAGWAGSGGDSVVLVWDGRSGALHRTLKGHTHRVKDVRFGSDGSRLFSLDSEANLLVWDLGPVSPDRSPEAAPDVSATDPNGVRTVEAGRKGRWGLVPGRKQPTREETEPDFEVRVREAGAERLRFKEHKAAVRDAAFSPDGAWVATLDAGGEVIVWDPASGKVRVRRQLAAGQSPAPQRTYWHGLLAFSRDASRLAVDYPSGTVRVLNADTGHELFAAVGKERLRGFCPQGRYVLTRVMTSTTPAFQSDEVIVWDVDTRREHFRLGQVSSTPRAVRFSEDGTRLAILTGPVAKLSKGGTSVKAKYVEIWDVTTGTTLLTLKRPVEPDWMDAAVFSPDGRRIATTSYTEYGVHRGAEVNVWDAVSGRHLRTIRESSSAIRDVAWSPDGTRLAAFVPTLVAAPKVKVWDADTGHELLTLDPSNTGRSPGTEYVVRFSRDGHRLLLTIGTPSEDAGIFIRAWDATPRPEPKK